MQLHTPASFSYLAAKALTPSKIFKTLHISRRRKIVRMPNVPSLSRSNSRCLKSRACQLNIRYRLLIVHQATSTIRCLLVYIIFGTLKIMSASEECTHHHRVVKRVYETSAHLRSCMRSIEHADISLRFSDYARSRICMRLLRPIYVSTYPLFVSEIVDLSVNAVKISVLAVSHYSVLRMWSLGGVTGYRKQCKRLRMTDTRL